MECQKNMHSMRAAAGEARAVDNVGHSRLDGLQQAGIIFRIVLQIGILDDHHIARRMSDCRL